MAAKNPVRASGIRPIRDKVFVTDLESGAQTTTGGIIIPDDDMTERGVRERWARIHAVGPDVVGLKAGDWVLLKHGRWTNGIDVADGNGETTRIWSVDYPDAVLVVTDSDPRRPRLAIDNTVSAISGGRGA